MGRLLGDSILMMLSIWFIVSIIGSYRWIRDNRMMFEFLNIDLLERVRRNHDKTITHFLRYKFEEKTRLVRWSVVRVLDAKAREEKTDEPEREQINRIIEILSGTDVGLIKLTLYGPVKIMIRLESKYSTISSAIEYVIENLPDKIIKEMRNLETCSNIIRLREHHDKKLART